MNKVQCFCLMMLGFMIYSCSSADGNENHEQNTAPIHNHDITSLKDEVAKHPDSAELIEELIVAYRDNEVLDSAISLTQSLLDKDTSNAYLWNMIATLYYQNGDTSRAIKSLEKAVSIYPLPDYYLALASIYARKKDDHALSIADFLLSQEDIGSNKTNVYFIKGLYYNFDHEPRKAIMVLDSALALDFTNMNAYREKAIALMTLNKYRDAVEVLRRATTLQNSFDEGYYWMGKAYEKINEPDSAILCYQTALLYDKNYTEAKEALKKLQKN